MKGVLWGAEKSGYSWLIWAAFEIAGCNGQNRIGPASNMS